MNDNYKNDIQITSTKIGLKLNNFKADVSTRTNKANFSTIVPHRYAISSASFHRVIYTLFFIGTLFRKTSASDLAKK